MTLGHELFLQPVSDSRLVDTGAEQLPNAVTRSIQFENVVCCEIDEDGGIPRAAADDVGFGSQNCAPALVDKLNLGARRESLRELRTLNGLSQTTAGRTVVAAGTSVAFRIHLHARPWFRAEIPGYGHLCR